MAKRSLILTSTSPEGKKLQKTITDINPGVGAAALKGFTQKLNALTTNTYAQTDCIDKFNVDTETPPTQPTLDPTNTLANPLIIPANVTDTGIVFDCTTDGDVYTEITEGLSNSYVGALKSSSGYYLGIHKVNTSSPHVAGKFKLITTAGEQYKASETLITVTVQS